MPGINNAAVGDNYTNAARILDVFTSNGGWFSIGNANAVVVQLQYGAFGATSFSDEQLLGAGAFGTIPPGCTGIQFRNATAGLSATVTAYIASGGPKADPRRASWPEPVLAISAIGNVTTPNNTVLSIAQLGVNASTAIGSGAATAIGLAAAYNFNNDPTTFPNRGSPASGFTVNTAGVYRCTGWAQYASTSLAGGRFTQLRQNGSLVLPGGVTQQAAQTLQTWQEVEGFADMAAGDFIELLCFQDSGGNLNVLGGFVTLEKIG